MGSFSLFNLWTPGQPEKAAAFIFAIALGPMAFASGTNDCNRQAVAILKQHSPTGYHAYQASADKSVFNFFSNDCSDRSEFLDSGVTTAVHETVHIIRSEKNAYHLVSNELLPVPEAPGYFAPKALVASLGRDPKIRDDDYFKTYLSNSGEGHASSRDEFTYLLDEMNAYTNDMQVQVDLAKIHPVTNRQGGLPALMTFVSAYAKHARENSPSTWKDLTSNPASETRLAVIKLWTQAEKTLARGCTVAPTTPNDDAAYIKHLCDTGQTGAMSAVLGRPARCPTECAADLKGPSFKSRESNSRRDEHTESIESNDEEGLR